MAATIRIDRRFRGPPASGNGGYVAGLVARALGGSDCEVTLLKPPPLERDLDLLSDGPGATLVDQGSPVASAVPRTFELEAPRPPSPDEALAASRRFAGFERHTFPGCFVCGPERGEEDGLRIFAGAAGGGVVAAPWTPSPDLCEPDGRLRSEFVWAALDCPGYFAVQEQAGPAVLGRLAVHIEERPACGKPLVVVGWGIESSGRKHRAGTALYSGEALVALGLATWISIPAPAA